MEGNNGIDNVNGLQSLGGATSPGAGNQGLSDAFDFAIQEANQTLTITTKKGADLYALKQRPQ